MSFFPLASVLMTARDCDSATINWLHTLRIVFCVVQFF